MGSSEKFCLRWNDFEGNISNSLASIREESQFFDCTLTTDDDEAYSDNLRAHKFILSSSSELFRKILTKKSMCAHPNPLIYLRGISAQDLTQLLDFVYYGEVNVAQDKLDKFLEIAESLQIKGLTQMPNRSRAYKRTSSHIPSPPLSPDVSSKKLKVQSDATFPSTSSTDNKLLFKDECDPLIPIDNVDVNDSLRDDDVEMGRDSVENFEKECEGHNEGNGDLSANQIKSEEGASITDLPQNRDGNEQHLSTRHSITNKSEHLYFTDNVPQHDNDSMFDSCENGFEELPLEERSTIETAVEEEPLTFMKREMEDFAYGQGGAKMKLRCNACGFKAMDMVDMTEHLISDHVDEL